MKQLFSSVSLHYFFINLVWQRISRAALFPILFADLRSTDTLCIRLTSVAARLQHCPQLP